MSDVITSQLFEGPFVRVRGHLSRQDVVTWSPCLRTYHPPNWVHHAAGTEGGVSHVPAHVSNVLPANPPLLETSALSGPFDTKAEGVPAGLGPTSVKGVPNPHYREVVAAEADPSRRRPVAPDPQPEPHPGRGKPTATAVLPADSEFTISFEDASGKELVRAPVRIRFFARERQWALFTQRLPYHTDTQRVVLRRREREVGALVVPKRVPEFVLVHPASAAEVDAIGVLHLRWELTADEKPHARKEPLTYFVRYNADERQWHRPGVNLTETSFDLDLREMPGGHRCVAQVIATNGYHTVYVETPPFSAPRKAPEILLATPRGPMLFAQGFSREDGPLVGESIVWLTDATKPVGTGASFDVRQLGRRTRELSVRVTDATGATTTQVLGSYDGETGRQITRPGY